jgi:hypothetical protein
MQHCKKRLVASRPGTGKSLTFFTMYTRGSSRQADLKGKNLMIEFSVLCVCFSVQGQQIDCQRSCLWKYMFGLASEWEKARPHACHLSAADGSTLHLLSCLFINYLHNTRPGIFLTRQTWHSFLEDSDHKNTEYSPIERPLNCHDMTLFVCQLMKAGCWGVVGGGSVKASFGCKH